MGDIHITGIDISTDSGTSTGSSTTAILSDDTATTTGTLHYGNITDLGYPNDYGGLDTEEEVSEEVQEKINKIGTPGKRNIDDLLNSFKVVADSKKGAPLEDLDDGTWMNEVMNMKEDPLSPRRILRTDS